MTLKVPRILSSNNNFWPLTCTLSYIYIYIYIYVYTQGIDFWEFVLNLQRQVEDTIPKELNFMTHKNKYIQNLYAQVNVKFSSKVWEMYSFMVSRIKVYETEEVLITSPISIAKEVFFTSMSVNVKWIYLYNLNK